MIDTLHQYSDVAHGYALGATTGAHNGGVRTQAIDSTAVEHVGSVGRIQSLSTYHTVPSIQQVNAISTANQEAVGASLEHLAELWTV